MQIIALRLRPFVIILVSRKFLHGTLHSRVCDHTRPDHRVIPEGRAISEVRKIGAIGVDGQNKGEAEKVTVHGNANSSARQ